MTESIVLLEILMEKEAEKRMPGRSGRRNCSPLGRPLRMLTDLNETEAIASVLLPGRPCIVTRFVKGGHQD